MVEVNIVENYIVFYVVSEEDDMITIIRISYGRRNWEHLL
jgi:toxin ParE1/3/4